MADGERRIVGAHGAGADEDGVALGAHAMGVGPRLVAGDPLARAVGRGGPAVDGRGELEHDIGPAGAPMGEVRRELRFDRLGLDADGDLDARGAQGGDAPPGDVRVGILDADDDTARCRPRRRRRRRAACGRWWLHGSSVVTSVAPGRGGAGAAQRFTLGVRDRPAAGWRRWR